MTKRRLIRSSLILAILAASAVWLEPTRVVWGWLRGEAFYQGRPSSYWADELVRWKPCLLQVDAFTVNWVYKRPPTRTEALLSRVISTSERTWSELLDRDAAGKKVLEELTSHSSSQVQSMAKEGLRRANSHTRGPQRTVLRSEANWEREHPDWPDLDPEALKFPND